MCIKTGESGSDIQIKANFSDFGQHTFPKALTRQRGVGGRLAEGEVHLFYCCLKAASYRCAVARHDFSEPGESCGFVCSH